MRRLFIISLLMGSSWLYAWERTYGGSGRDGGLCVRQTYDRGYIIGGYGSIGGLIKTDSRGNILWTKEPGGRCVQQTLDKGYVVVGFEEGEEGFYLIKTDSMGNTLWRRNYRRGDCMGLWVEQTLDRGYILTGWSLDLNGYAILIIKTDSIGDTIWTRTYPNNSGGGIEGSCVRQTSDKGYIVLGSIERGVSAVFNIILLKLDSNGDTLWTKTYGYGGDTTDYGRVVQETSDSGYIIVGTTGPFPGRDRSIYLIKTDRDGNTLWIKTYRGSGSARGEYVQQTSDGGYIIAGSTSDGTGDVYLLKTDENGDSLWAKTYGGDNNASGYCVQQTSDKGYIIVGSIWRNMEDTDIYLIKTDSLGNSQEEPAVKEISENIPLFLSITPNPTKDEAIIRFGGKTLKPSRLSLYDINGRKVNELWRGELNGNYILRLNKRELPSGIYFLQLEAGNYIKRGKVIVE